VITERRVKAWVGPATMTSGSGHSTVVSNPSRGSTEPMKKVQSSRPSRTEVRLAWVLREWSEIWTLGYRQHMYSISGSRR
jgi:hypothetical protein